MIFIKRIKDKAQAQEEDIEEDYHVKMSLKFPTEKIE